MISALLTIAGAALPMLLLALRNLGAAREAVLFSTPTIPAVEIPITSMIAPRKICMGNPLIAPSDMPMSTANLVWRMPTRMWATPITGIGTERQKSRPRSPCFSPRHISAQAPQPDQGPHHHEGDRQGCPVMQRMCQARAAVPASSNNLMPTNMPIGLAGLNSPWKPGR